MAALSGPLSKRRLGTNSGQLRRLARQAERDGATGAADKLYLAAAQEKLGEGSAISSAEGNIAAADYERRAQQGIARGKMGLTTAATGGLLEKRQQLFNEAKTAGGFTDDMRSRARELGVTDSGLTLAERKIPTVKPGNTGSVAGDSVVNSVPILGGVLSAVPREGRINGMPASRALASMRRPGDDEPGNLAELKARDAADREAAINTAISESAGNAKVTRSSVIDRINKERVAAGREAYGDDIFKEIGERDKARSESITAANVAFRDVSPAKPAASLTPPPAMGPPKPPSFVGPPKPNYVTSAAARPISRPMFSGGTSFTTPEGMIQRKEKSLADYRKTKRDEYMKAWNATPDMGVVDPDSIANKTYKSLRTFFSGKSY